MRFLNLVVVPRLVTRRNPQHCDRTGVAISAGEVGHGRRAMLGHTRNHSVLSSQHASHAHSITVTITLQFVNNNGSHFVVDLFVLLGQTD